MGQPRRRLRKRLHEDLPAWRHRAYEALEHGPIGDGAMRIVSR